MRGLVPIRDTDTARRIAALRWEKHAAARRAGVGDAAGDIPGLAAGDKYAMVRHIAYNHALNAADPSARGSAASARLTFEAFEPRRTDGGGQVAGLTDAETDAMRELVAQYRHWRQGQAGAGDGE